MDNKWPIIEIHELDEGRRYLSTRVGEGMDLVIFATPISEQSVEDHEQLLDQKVRDYKASQTEKDND